MMGLKLIHDSKKGPDVLLRDEAFIKSTASACLDAIAGFHGSHGNHC